jgi:hypothetical protein
MARSINHLLTTIMNSSELIGWLFIGAWYTFCAAFVLTILNFVLSMIFGIPFIPGLILEACGVNCADTINYADTY